MCDVLNIPRSTYYKSLDQTISNREQENRRLTERIIDIHIDSKQRYGAPKIHIILEQEGFQFSLKRIQRLMKKANIKSITVKKFRPISSEKVVERKKFHKGIFLRKVLMKNGLAI